MQCVMIEAATLATPSTIRRVHFASEPSLETGENWRCA